MSWANNHLKPDHIRGLTGYAAQLHFLDPSLTHDGEDHTTIHRVQGNLYTHFGAPNGEELRLLALRSNERESALRMRGWTPRTAARATGLDERDIAVMKNGSLRRFHAGNLLDALTKLGCSITVVSTRLRRGSCVIYLQGIDDE